MPCVAIVDYGPTGATLAHLLGQCGLRVMVFDRESAACHLPRAVHFDGEVMRVFQAIGIAGELEPLSRDELAALLAHVASCPLRAPAPEPA